MSAARASFRYSFDFTAQGDDAALSSLDKIFSYVDDHQQLIDSALVPPFPLLETIHHNIARAGLKGLRASDGETILNMLVGLQSLSAETVPGYYDQDDFERATMLAQKIAQGLIS